MRTLLLVFLSLATLLADAPYNSNLLVEQRIDPTILNNVVSSTRQDVAYRMKIDHMLLIDDKEQNFQYFLIVDPYPSYGTELKIQVAKSELKDVDVSKVKRTLDELMGVQLYLQHGDLYDINSLKLVSDEKMHKVISFTFKEDALPRELKHVREMTGYVHIVDGLLQKIVVKNGRRFELRSIEVDSYEKVVYFRPVKAGGYLVSKEYLNIEGSFDGRPYHERATGVVTEYWNAQRKAITFDDGLKEQLVDIDNGDYKTISVDLDRFFPILGQEARKAGFDLPKPFGVTLINMFQDTTMHMTSFKIDGVPIDFNKVIDGDSTYRSLTYAPLVRADLWVLPFVSFGLLLGGTDTTTDVVLRSDSGLSVHSPFPIPGGTDYDLIAPGGSLALEPFGTNSLLYGLGATVAGGFDNYFTTIDFQYIIAYTPDADVTIDMMIITPLIGYTFTEYGARLFIGAQYQRLTESLTFEVPIPNSANTLSGEVGLRSEEWAGVIGTDYAFTRNWSANLMYSQGIDRKNAVLGISYRF